MHSVLMLVLLPQLWIVLVLGAPQFGPSIEHHQRFMDVGAQQLNVIVILYFNCKYIIPES